MKEEGDINNLNIQNNDLEENGLKRPLLENDNNDFGDSRASFFKRLFQHPPFQKFLYHFYFVFLSLIYLTISTFLPFLNKTIFTGGYDFPLTSSLFQTLGSSVVLLLFNLVQYRHNKNNIIPRSYFFDKNFVYKSLIMIPVSVCFGAVMILTNIGVDIAPVNYHVVFKSTNIIWIVLFSILINKEKPSLFEYISIATLMAGALMVGWVFATSNKASFVPIFINLLSSFFESFTVVLLKWSCSYLYRYDDTITVIEISLFKVVQGSFVIFIPMVIKERFHGFAALGDIPSKTIWLLVIGIFVTMVFQTAMVCLSKSFYSTTIGIIGQLQIIPQTLISIALYQSFVFTGLHIAGVSLVILGCVIFALFHFSKIYFQKKKEQAF
ncbi:hypothetical protein CYY_008558 [Polysphondylium violaceum]|uniref:Sugar phosphate transporter domain-containing protein n=1 Tax=Polysphondylium violaceum TaxID=133409 RepID=A0A8J4PNA9_9MYCE|nr:hypothetical protein CYY_008558 [Polysphondylium violaceum]